MRKELYPYLHTLATNEGAVLLAIGGGLDHVHLLLNVRPSKALSDLVRSLKATSSRWVRDQFNRSFAWQSGYAAFSVSKSNQAVVHAYIEGQEEHHKRVDFETEYVSLLKKNAIEFENDRLW